MQLTLGQKQVMDHNHIAINKNETMKGLSKYEKKLQSAPSFAEITSGVSLQC